MENTPVEIVVIMDASGSMHEIRNAAVEGFNSFLAKQQEMEGAANLTLITFNTDATYRYSRVPIKDAKKLTLEDFNPAGGTALNDSLAAAIIGLNFVNPKRAILCVITDGQENASTKFKAVDVKALIKNCEQKDWVVSYVSSDLSALKDADSQLGIKKEYRQLIPAGIGGQSLGWASNASHTTSYRAGS